MLNRSLTDILIIVPVILVSLTIHELAHASVSLLLGDDTAKRAGRVTLNPLRHVDPLGFLMLVVVGFGWAKPVVFDPTKLRKRVRDEILVSFAGPLSNLLLAMVAAVVLRLIVLSETLTASPAYETVINIAVTFCVINIALAVFNSLPIPPLDGSHLYTSFLSERNAALSATVTRYGVGLLLILIVLNRVVDVNLLPIGPAINAIYEAMLRLVGL